MRDVFAVRTPHQAERLGLAERAAHGAAPPAPLEQITRALALGDGLDVRLASRAEAWIAARHEAERAGLVPGEEATAERRAAVIAAWDGAVGWHLRTGASAIGGRGASGSRLADRVTALLGEAARIDARAVPWRARALARGRGDLEGCRVVVSGIVPLEIDTLAAIEALHFASSPGGGVRLVLPRPAGDDDGALAAHLERRWGALDDAPEIEWLAPRAEPVDVERIEAPSAAAEAREVAARVARAIAEGTPPEEIAVVVDRADDPLATLVALGLGDAGIPSSRERGEPVERSPEAMVSLDLLSMAAGRITRDGLADLLRAPGLHAGSWVGAAHEAEASRAALAIAHRLRSIPVAVDRARGARIVEALEAVDARSAAAVTRLCDQLADLGALRGRGAIAHAFGDLVHRLRLGRPGASELGAALRGEAKEQRVGAARLRAIGEGARGTAQVVEIARALGEAEAKLGLVPQPVEGAELLAEIRELSRGATATSAGGAPRAGAVRVATARDLVGVPHALVVVTGLGASAYGAAEVRGLVDEEQLARLGEPHRPPPIVARRAGRAMELQWLARDAARLVLTRRAGGAGGSDETPHRYFADVSALEPRARGGDVRRAPASSVLADAQPASRRDRVRAELAAGRDVKLPTAVGGAVAAARRAHAERTKFFLDPRVPPGRFSGAISPHRAPALAIRFGGDAPERSIAVTHVERAARCPFAGFASRVLRARRVEDALEDANPRERGTLVHVALHAAFEAMRAAPPAEDAASLRRRAEDAALAATRADAATPLRREAILAAVRDAMAVVDLDLASGDASFYALGERRFGAGEAPPWDALPLAGDAGPVVWVDGQIDRIDRATDARWARIVDYKTGKLPRKKDEHHRALQLSIYADAVSRWLASAAASPGEVSGRYVESKRGAARVRDVDVDGDARAAARDSARRVVLGLWSGDVGARTVDPRTCRRCEARDVCRKPAVAVDDDVTDAEPDEIGARP